MAGEARRSINRSKQWACADRIRHIRNGGEQSVRTIVDSYFVDGYDSLTRTVYGFHGCLYHGCPRCYPNRQAKHYAVPDRNVEELYQATLSKRMALLRASYTVIELWECEWDHLVDTDETVQRLLNSFDLAPPLEPREAFLGGQNGAVALHAVAGEGEEIRYVGVTSGLPLPLGEQELPLPYRSSADHHAALRPVPGVEYLASPPWIFFPPPACSTLSCPCAVVKNSPFLSATPVSRRSRPNPCWTAPSIVLIPTPTVCCAGPGTPATPHRPGLFKDYVNTWLKVKQESAEWPS